MDRLEFRIQGSAIDPYRVGFLKNGNIVGAYCSCPAGLKAQHCKHRFALLEGITDGIVSDNQADVATVKDWVIGTPLGEAFLEMRAAEAEFETAKKLLAKAKRRVALEMNR